MYLHAWDTNSKQDTFSTGDSSCWSRPAARHGHRFQGARYVHGRHGCGQGFADALRKRSGVLFVVPARAGDRRQTAAQVCHAHHPSRQAQPAVHRDGISGRPDARRNAAPRPGRLARHGGEHGPTGVRGARICARPGRNPSRLEARQHHDLRRWRNPAAGLRIVERGI